ncbi:hypothetical protein WICPIJ_002457 [Wickerhamomyces pijperi]|uniref:Bacterial surface antigen (D15) domain-containing protein n=1 Tax=Wickerhamomyces pijperi TaxID=599730 RepID=A0A9P8QBT9_WICPI|nr:hypothetical protein WICPIJ_002457 [Wickerhamomyces pijperi]
MDLKDEDSVVNRVQSTFKDPSISDIPDKYKKLQELELERHEIITSETKRYLEQLYRVNATRQVHVPQVLIEGTELFRDSFLIKQIEPLINQSSNIGSFLKNIDTVHNNLVKCGALENLVFQIDQQQSSTVLSIVPKIKIFPAKRFLAKTGTNVGNGEGDGYITIQYKNIFGGCENLIFDATTGTRTRSSYLLNYNSPLRNNVHWRFDVSGFVNSRKIDWCSHEQTLKGLNLKVSGGEGLWKHEFSVENILRGITNVKFQSSDLVKLQAGFDLKNSLVYKLTKDSRDDATLPTKGCYFQSSTEMSGLLHLTTSKFIKQNFESTFARSFNQANQIINLNFKTGLLYTFNDKSHIMDRFNLGGPNDIRGFFYNGLGPRQYQDTLGGDVYFSSGISLFQRIPGIFKDFHGTSNGLLGHGFINVGNLSSLNKDETVLENLTEVLGRPSITVGTGLVFKHPIARFELNLVCPLVCHASDERRVGIQYGIGLSFM